MKNSFSKSIILGWKLFFLSTLKMLFHCLLTPVVVKSSVSLIFIPLKDSIFAFWLLLTSFLGLEFTALNSLEFLNKRLESDQFGEILNILFYHLLEYQLDVCEIFSLTFCLLTLSFIYLVFFLCCLLLNFFKPIWFL